MKNFVKIIPLFLVGEIYLVNLLIIVGFLFYPPDYLEVLGVKLKYLYTISVYIFTAALLILDKGDLSDFNLDRFSITMLVAGIIFRSILGIPGEVNLLVWTRVSGVLVIIVVIKKWKLIPITNFKWAAIGVISGFAILIPTIPIEALQPITYLGIDFSKSNVFVLMFQQFIYNLSFVAPIEEIVFRGFLWGFLKRLGWNVEKIIVAQGILFWFTHIIRLGTPLTFFITIPLGIIIFSLLTRYSKQLSAPILAHLVSNSLIPVMVKMAIGS